MARRKRSSVQRLTPAERERQLANQERLERVLAERLARDGTTREEIHRRLGLSPPPGRLT